MIHIKQDNNFNPLNNLIPKQIEELRKNNKIKKEKIELFKKNNLNELSAIDWLRNKEIPAYIANIKTTFDPQFMVFESNMDYQIFSLKHILNVKLVTNEENEIFFCFDKKRNNQIPNLCFATFYDKKIMDHVKFIIKSYFDNIINQKIKIFIED